MSEKLIRGTFLLTFATILSKIIGLLYVIPFKAIVGDGVTLYSYAYIPYTIFISIATAGIPLAVSKYVSKYNALNEYAVGRRLFRSGLVIMSITGLIAFLILYSIAPLIAPQIIIDSDQVTKIEDVVTVIRAVSFALIIVPTMSIIRGFFQGHQSMGPSAVSTVVEQIVRVTFVLAGTFIVLKVMDGTIVTAISVATFAAFVGAIGGLIVLIVYWFKRKPNLDSLLAKDQGTVKVSLVEIYKEIIQYSIPFVFVGIANPLFQLVDQFTFNRAMSMIGLAQHADKAFGILNFDTHKIIIIPVSLATAFSLTLVPSITKAFVKGERQSLHEQLDQTFQVLLFITIPAAIGISLLAEPVYTMFYGYEQAGVNVLAFYAPVAVLFSLFAVTAAIMQGINEQRFTIFSLLLGLLVKLSINIPLIKLYETKGAILATAIGYLVAIVVNLFVINYFAQYRYRFVFRRVLLFCLFTIIMSVVTLAVYSLLTLVIAPNLRIGSLIVTFICAIVGAGVYFYLSFRTKIIYMLFGSRVDKIKSKLRF